MTDHTPIWTQLQSILQDELAHLRNIHSMTSEIERAHHQQMATPAQQELKEAFVRLETTQRRRFETTKNIIDCSEFSLQNDYFTKWLKDEGDDCETTTLWEQVQALIEKIEDQKERNAMLQYSAIPKEIPLTNKKPIETIDLE